jgi:hypothetical protein
VQKSGMLGSDGLGRNAGLCILTGILAGAALARSGRSRAALRA